MGGVKAILVALQDDIAVWPQEIATPTSMDENVKLSGIPVMKTGKRMFKLYCKNDAGEYKCTGQGEEGSRSQLATLEIYNPGFRAKITGFLRAVQNAQLVLIVLTNQGEWHMMGDRYRGAILAEFEATSGKATTDANGASMTFQYNTPSDRIVELTDAQVEVLCTVNGSMTEAAISDIGDSNISSSGATLTATFTNNQETITKVGFRYRKEGDADWTEKASTSFTSGTAKSFTISGLTTGSDYLYYAYMVVDGQERYSETFAFTTL
jgi:hypothetical protein